MPLAVELNPEGRLATALVQRMNQLDLTIRQLAERTGLTYEHIRKLVALTHSGSLSPSIRNSPSPPMVVEGRA